MRYLLISLLFFSGCISVELPGGKSKNSSTMSFETPQPEYDSYKLADADKAWIQKSSGNSISVKSACSDTSDVNPQAWLEGLIQDFEGQKETLTEFNFNNREAYASEFFTSIDGVENLVQVLTFNKNHCHYILTSASVKPHFDKARVEFKNFYNGFRVP